MAAYSLSISHPLSLAPALALTHACTCTLILAALVYDDILKALSNSPLELLTFHMIMRVYVCMYASAGKCVRVRMCVCVCLRVCVCMFVCL